MSIALVLGAVGLGAAASALDGSATDPALEEPTTTMEEQPTTSELATTTEPATSEPTTTVEEPPPTEAPATTQAPATAEAPATTVAPEVAANAFGQCTAFAGRSQPGNSQAWTRLHDVAGGDIDGYCAGVLAARGGELDDQPEPDEPAEQPSDEAIANSAPGRGPGSNGRGNGGGKGGR